MITSITDRDGATLPSTGGILHTIVEFLKDKYGPNAVNDASVTLREHVVLKPLEWRESLEEPITEEDLNDVVNQGACSKAPGRDGIRLEFHNVFCNSIKVEMLALYNQMYSDGWIMK